VKENSMVILDSRKVLFFLPEDFRKPEKYFFFFPKTSASRKSAFFSSRRLPQAGKVFFFLPGDFRKPEKFPADILSLTGTILREA
jgi:hypothetical protein